MIKALANLVSVLFHPLYIILYIYGLLMVVNPYQFSSYNHTELGVFFISLFVLSVIIPIIGILMMRFLGLIGGLELRDKTDRIGPLIVTGICYLWLTVNFFNSSEVSLCLTSFMLGATISLFLGFVVNLGEKVSLHTIGMGGFLAGFAIMMLKFGYGYATFTFGSSQYQVHLMLIFAGIVIACGLVATSRLYLRAHVPREIYGGFLIGLMGQIIALRIVF